MKNDSKTNAKSCLTAALAALIAFSAMAASVMAGCGENGESAASGDAGETEIVTIVGTQVVTETRIVDATANSEGNSGGSDSESSGGSEGSGNSSGSEGSGNSSGSDSKSSTASNGGNNASSSSGKTTSSSSNKNDSSSAANSSSGSSSGSKVNSSVCRVDGQKFKVGDTIVCTYRLSTPKTLENYQGTIKYDSKCLKATKAKLESPAKTGGIINYKNSGRIDFNGINIGDGYDYTKGGKFLTVTYEVLSGGTVNTSIDWVAACVFDDSDNNLIKNGKPVSGFTVSKSYTKA